MNGCTASTHLIDTRNGFRVWEYIVCTFMRLSAPSHNNRHSPKVAFISLKVIIAVRSQWLCESDSSVTVCQLGNKPVSSAFTMMKAGTFKVLCRLSLYTCCNESVFHRLHPTWGSACLWMGLTTAQKADELSIIHLREYGWISFKCLSPKWKRVGRGFINPPFTPGVREKLSTGTFDFGKCHTFDMTCLMLTH